MTTVRQATITDAPVLTAMMLKCVVEDDIGIPLTHDWQQQAIGMLISYLTGIDRAVLIAEDEGNPEGMILVSVDKLTPYHVPVATFGNIYVNEEYRGGRTAFKLCIATWEWMRGTGMTHAMTWNPKPSHNPLYERGGLVPRATLMAGRLE